MEKNSLTNLPKDLKPLIVSQLLSANTPQEAVQNLKNFALVNKEFTSMIKDPQSLFSLVLQVIPSNNTPEQVGKILKTVTLLNPAVTTVINNPINLKKLLVPYVKNFVKNTHGKRYYTRTFFPVIKKAIEQLNIPEAYQWVMQNMNFYTIDNRIGNAYHVVLETNNPTVSEIYQAAAQVLNKSEEEINLTYRRNSQHETIPKTDAKATLASLNIPQNTTFYYEPRMASNKSIV